MGNFFSQDEIPGTLPKDEIPGGQPLGRQGTSVVGQFHGPLLRVDDGRRPLANAGDAAKALAPGRFNHSVSTSASPSTLPKDEILGSQLLGRQGTSVVGQFHGPLLRVDDGRRPLANAGDAAKALAPGRFNHSVSTSASPSTLPKYEIPSGQPLGRQGTSVVGQFHGPLLRVDDGRRPLANAGDAAKALAPDHFNHSVSTSASPSTLPKDKIPGGQPLGRQGTSVVGQFHGPLLHVDDGRRPLANAGDAAKALAPGRFNHSGSTSASPSTFSKDEIPGGQPLGRQGTSVVGQFHGVNEQLIRVDGGRRPLANAGDAAKAIVPRRFNPSGSTSASPSTSTEILTAEGKKMRAVADYWARMKKGKRTLDSWDLTYLECKIFSWSLEGRPQQEPAQGKGEENTQDFRIAGALFGFVC
ncbi:hypothetical protein ACQ4PT_060689 [Festuca glaucescens]